MGLILLMLVCVFIVTIFSIKRYIFLNRLKCFPTAPGWPLIGSILDFLDYTKTMWVVHDYVKKYGPNIVINALHRTQLIVTEPKFTEFAMTSTKLIQKGPTYRLLHNWFGDGLLTSYGEKWKTHRKILTPTFHYKILEDFIKTFENSSHILIEKLSKECDKKSFEIDDYISLHTLDIIYESAMGTNINAQKSPDSDFVRSVKTMVHIIIKRLVSIHLNPDVLYFFSQTRREEMKALKVLHKYSRDVIAKRKKALMEKNIVEEEISDIGIKRKITFLDTLLTATIDGRHLTDAEVKEEVDTFIFEGHDTTSGAISFALYELSRHPEIQNKVFEEITNIFGDDFQRPTTIQDLQSMHYLDMVIKETLRIYPSVPAFGRTVMEDVEYDGVLLPKGLELVMSPALLHRNPEIYPDPDNFDPERFSIENISNRHPFAYVPFSGGHRNCIGQKFAMLEMKTTLSMILKRYELVAAIPEHLIELCAGIVLVSLNGIKIAIKERSV